MGIKKYLNIIVIAGFIVFSVFALWYCKADDGEGSYYCYNCITTMPDSAEMVVKVTINDQNPSVPLVIYSGKYSTIGENEILKVDTASVGTYKIYVPTNKTYSVMAKYKDGNRIINAVDGGDFDRQEQSGCETTCWQLIGGSYDVQLKEY